MAENKVPKISENQEKEEIIQKLSSDYPKTEEGDGGFIKKWEVEGPERDKK